MKKKARVIPNVNIYPIDDIPAEMLVKIDLLVSTVHDEVLPAINQAIKGKKSTATLFQINFTDAYLELLKSEWAGAIDSSIEYFSKKENYEVCGELTALKSKLEPKKKTVNGRV